MSTQVSLSKCYIVDESDSPVTMLRKINTEIVMLQRLIEHLQRSKREIEVENRDYLEIIKEYI